MTTAVRQAAEDAAETAMCDPSWPQLWQNITENWGSGHFDPVVEACFPIHAWGRWNTRGRAKPEGVLLFSKIEAAIRTGQVALALIPVGSEPGANSDMEGNNAKLAAIEPSDFRAVFHGEPYGPDGWVECLRGDLLALAHVQSEDDGLLVESWYEPIPRGKISLEVGAFDPCRGWLDYIAMGRPLAVWAYGRKDILLVIPTCRSLDASAD